MAELRRRVPESNEVPLLDDTQQNAVLDEFRRQARAARRQTQLIIGPLGTALCLAYFYFAIQALLDPWSVRHHAELIDVLRPVAIAAGEAISGVAMAGSLAAVIANCRLRPALGRSILQSSVLTTILVSLFWSMALAKMLRLHSYELDGAWRVFWLPLAPAVWSLICVSLINTIQCVQADLRRLRAARYRLHSA
ncbi:hypothetical protein QBZ16_000113 [Prototheca wickerhamii]|uniref:Uncharacterized protein n=1 Tax=Prototheca wickerhamii TaxID=3111 RepID=A0AAD9IMQ1_PROWI|nr:hypothetical protein QBZ16_000113 [Prototheca wickerhamii]